MASCPEANTQINTYGCRCKESVRDAESREHSRKGGVEDERHINLSDDHNKLPEDRRHEQTSASRGARSVPDFETLGHPHTTAKKPWWRRLLGD